jgi:hypothetical protein
MKTIAKILTMLLFLLPAPLVAETVPAIDVEELFALVSEELPLIE